MNIDALYSFLIFHRHPLKWMLVKASICNHKSKTCIVLVLAKMRDLRIINSAKTVKKYFKNTPKSP